MSEYDIVGLASQRRWSSVVLKGVLPNWPMGRIGGSDTIVALTHKDFMGMSGARLSSSVCKKNGCCASVSCCTPDHGHLYTHALGDGSWLGSWLAFSQPTFVLLHTRLRGQVATRYQPACC